MPRDAKKTPAQLTAELKEAREELARLSSEAKQRSAELEIINSVQQSLAEKFSLEEIYDAVGDKIREIFDAQAVMIGSRDMQAKQGINHYFFEKGKKYFPSSLPVTSLMKHITKTGETVVINTNMAEESKKYGMKTIAGESPKSGVWVPYKVAGQLTGIISLQNIDRENAFSEADIRLLETLAGSMSSALENARLFDESKQRSAELEIINSVQQSLAAKLSLAEIYDAVGDKIRDIFDAQVVLIGGGDIQTEQGGIRYFYSKGKKYYPDPTPPSDLVKHIFETGESVVINTNMAAESKKYGMKIIAGELPKSGVWVPYQVGSQVFGLISLQNIDRENAFSEADIRLLETLTGSMSSALENALLFDELQKSHQKTSLALERQTATSDILHMIANSPGDIKPVLEVVAKHAAKLCEADNVHIYKTENNRLVQLAHFGSQPVLEDGMSMPLVKGLITAQAVNECRTIHFDAGELSEEEFPESVKLHKRLKHRTMLITPLIREDMAIGAIGVSRNQVKPFTDEQIELLNTFSNQAAISIENVRLFTEVERQNEYLEALISSSPVAIVTLDMNGNVTGWSPAAVSLFGYSAEEA
ncbi:MAG: GAF domain-containing protein, partial [Anaerolineae bacterium]|nr:GAF domain-containing protein [Anaerolineae bacterium]